MGKICLRSLKAEQGLTSSAKLLSRSEVLKKKKHLQSSLLPHYLPAVGLKTQKAAKTNKKPSQVPLAYPLQKMLSKFYQLPDLFHC